MNKLKNKLKLLKVIIPLFFKIIKFRIRVFLYKISNRTGKIKKVIFSIFFILFFIFVAYFLFLSAPSDFPVGTIFQVERGNSLRSVSLKLKDAYIIRSRTAFEAFVILFGRERQVISAGYFFEEKLPVYEIARRIAKGEFNIAQIKVTIPEGLNNKEIADIFGAKLIFFDKDKFLLNASKKEGSLFPDTYYFFITDNEIDVMEAMSKNFEKKIAPIRPEIVFSDRGEKEVIIMASILEKEAKGDADREFISGILWKRIGIGMALQVDAMPETYKIKGLPKNPIGNPGLEAIDAAINPKNSPYLYYLHDKSGIVHYAKTFAEHKANKLKYLGN